MPVRARASSALRSRPRQCSCAGSLSLTNRISRRETLPGISTRIVLSCVSAGQVVEVAVLAVFVVDVERVALRSARSTGSASRPAPSRSMTRGAPRPQVVAELARADGVARPGASGHQTRARRSHVAWRESPRRCGRGGRADVHRVSAIVMDSTIFPGFIRLSGSSARLIVRMISSAAPCSASRYFILPMPTPCSPRARAAESRAPASPGARSAAARRRARPGCSRSRM